MKTRKFLSIVMTIIVGLSMSSCSAKKNDPKEEEIIDMSGQKPVVGNFCSYYIDEQNQLWSWGRAIISPYDESQLGIETDTDKYGQVKILEDVFEVIPGYNFSFAIKKDMTLWAWGNDEDGSLGAGIARSATPIQILDNVKEVKISTNHVLALKMDGTLWGWGYNYENVLGVKTDKTSTNVPIMIMEDVIYFTTGYSGSMAVTKDHSLWSWGMEFDGLSNNDHNAESAKPKKIMDEVSRAYIINGDRDYYVIKTDDTLWAWGENAEGYIGNGSTGKIVDPVLILRDVLDFKFDFNRYALLKNNELRGWGPNNKLINRGEDNDLNYTRPELVMYDVIDFAVDYDHVVIIDEKTRSLWTWGVYKGSDEGLDLYIKLASYQAPTFLISNVVNFSVGRSHSLAVDGDGIVWTWGDNYYGQLGKGHNEQSGGVSGSSFN